MCPLGLSLAGIQHKKKKVLNCGSLHYSIKHHTVNNLYVKHIHFLQWDPEAEECHYLVSVRGIC